MLSGRSPAKVTSASPWRICTRSPTPASSMCSRAMATFEASNSLPISTPPPLSRRAAARCRVDRPNEVPNSTMLLALALRASRYKSLPVSRETGSHRSLSNP